MSLLLVAVSCGPKLSEDDARRILNDKFGYPILKVFELFGDNNRKNKPKVEERYYIIDDLKTDFINQGMMIPGQPQRTSIGWITTEYQITEKGKANLLVKFKHKYWPYKITHPKTKKKIYYSTYTMRIALAEEHIKDVVEILIEKENSIAHVTFTTTLSPLGLYDYICGRFADKTIYCSDKSYQMNSIYREKTIKMKKYDKRWRVIE
jgi:hypothetical protein